MSTIEDFKNAPVGATATRADGGRAMKSYEDEWSWIELDGRHMGDKEMVYWGYTLDPSAPASAREALELVWELAHEVKEGQVIPKGTRYLEVTGSGLKENTAQFDIEVSFSTVPEFRTLEPLPDPEPDWLDAPAVIAHTDNNDDRHVWASLRDDQWASLGHTFTRHWSSLRDVTPLYPKGLDA